MLLDYYRSGVPKVSPMTAPLARPFVSVIVTVLNRADSIRHLLASLDAQTLPPDDEIVLADGGSADRTLAILKTSATSRPYAQVLALNGANISEGRNHAISTPMGQSWLSPTRRHAGGKLVERLVPPLIDDPQVDVVSGFFASDPEATFEWALGATVLPTLTTSTDGSCLRVARSPSAALPGRRSAAIRSGWITAKILSSTEPFRRRATALPGRPRRRPVSPARNLRRVRRQYFRYARGDGKADLWRGRHAIRYGTYLQAWRCSAARRHPSCSCPS